MRGSKWNLDEASAQLLKTMKFRTGLTHQYLCRIAFCLSLSENSPVEPCAYNERGPEFNRYTLLGEYDTLFVGFLREWMLGEPRAAEFDEGAWFLAHINRGLELLPRRVRTLADVADLVPAAA